MKLSPLAAALPLALPFFPAAFAQGTAELFTGGFETPSTATRFEATFDFDGDGDLDAFSWWWKNCWSYPCDDVRMRTYENQQEGQLEFLGETNFTLQGWWDEHEPAVWVGDLDQDPSKAEVVFYRGGFFYLFQVWRADGGFPQHRAILVQETETSPACDSNWIDNERAIAVNDYNQDGRLDVALTNGTQLYLMLQDAGSLSFTEGQAVQIKPSLTCSLSSGQSGFKLDLETGEFNGDGRPDIVAIRQQHLDWNDSWSVPELIITPVAGGQLFPPTIRTLAVGPGARIALGDIDGDDDLDGVIFGANGYQVWRRNASGAMSLEALRAGGPATDLADIDGDGDLDGICCGGGGGGPIGNTSASQFELCLNDGNGNFDDAVSFPSIGGHHVAGVIDVDGDGDVDLLGGRTTLLNHTRAGAPFCLAGQNSTGAFARLSATGDVSLSRGNLALRATGAPASTVGLFFLGETERPAGTPLGDGNLCLGGALRRLPALAVDADGQAILPLDLSNVAIMGAVPEPGETLRMQFWFRDGAGGSNTTAGLRLVVAP